MRKVKFFVLSVIFSICLLRAFAGQPSIEPVFDPLDFFTPSQDGATLLTADQIFMLSLRYSECEPGTEEWQSCMDKFEAIKNEVSSRRYQIMSEEERGRAVLKLLYRDYLKTYSAAQTRINVALEKGLYNCVSSALLYMASAKAAGLDVRGQKTSEHAFCSIYIPRKIDVETTNPYGFNPGSRETIKNENAIKGYYVVPKKFYTNRQEVSDILFAGLIAGNLCSFYLDKNDYTNAVPLGAARYQALVLEKNQSKAVDNVRREFDVLAANYVNTLPKKAKDFYEIVDWYAGFMDRWGKTDFLQRNMDNACYNLMVMCFDEKNHKVAADSFKRFKPYLTQNQISKNSDILTDILVTSKTEGQSAEEQIELIEDLFASGAVESSQEKRVLVYLENAWLMILNDCMNSRNYGTGYQKSCEALERLPQSTKIKKMQKSFYDNCIAIIHNNFADQANAKRFDQARQVLEAGMQVFPDDKTLNADMTTLNRIEKK